MRVWLDDVRPAPPGWEWANTAEMTIDLLKTGQVTEMSLDHDLGLPWLDDAREKTGYDVLAWLEEQIQSDRWEWPIPVIHIHTRNPVGWKRMTDARERIRAGS